MTPTTRRASTGSAPARGRAGVLDEIAARRAGRAGVLDEIAARRAADVAAELGGTTYATLATAAAAAPAPRDVTLALAAPGCHLIAEVKRSSPSAGSIAAGADPVTQARAYVAGGATAISVLCEPHWFGGALDDLRAVRAAVPVPVLAKEFVVDPRQLPLVRAAGADLVLLLAALHPRRRLADLAARARDLGLEPLVEVHAEREMDAALESGARLIGVNARDLRTLAVDPERVTRMRVLVPADRLAIGESGVRDAATIARWRAVGYDAALVGEALMRAGDPAATARSFVAAGVTPDDPSAAARAPFVKICGLTGAEDVFVSLRAAADAIGLNLVPGTPRALALSEAVWLSLLARGASTPAGRPKLVAVTADATPAAIGEAVAAINPDAIQLSGHEDPAILDGLARPAWKVLHVPADVPAHQVRTVAGELIEEGRRWLDAGAARLLLDTAGGRHPGGTGQRASADVAAAVARELPIVLAGGLNPGNVGAAVLEIPAVGVDVAAGAESARPTEAAGSRPHKDSLKVLLFAKRARAARFDRPVVPFGPTPVHPGLLETDARGHWGVERDFGGRFVPETLVAALEQLEAAWTALRGDPVFWSELRELLAHYAGRPTALYRADRLAVATLAEARRLDPTSALPPTLRLYLKRIAETGAGQHGVATATACALLGLPCVVYMGEEDIRRQAPNVLRMRALGAEVRAVTSGTGTLKDAVNEAMRDWVTNVTTTHYVLGSAMGPHPYPTIVRDLQRRIGDEAATQISAVEGRLPDLALACVGGGSNAIGLLARFIGEPSVRLAVAEAAGDGMETGRHAAAIRGGTPGILHGSRSLMLQDRDGQVIEAVSASAGLDYPGVGPQLAALAEGGRLAVVTASDREAVAAMKACTLTEGILPALETAHAVAALPKLLAGVDGVRFDWPADALVLIGFSGRGDKDLAALERFADVEPWEAAR